MKYINSSYFWVLKIIKIVNNNNIINKFLHKQIKKETRKSVKCWAAQIWIFLHFSVNNLLNNSKKIIVLQGERESLLIYLLLRALLDMVIIILLAITHLIICMEHLIWWNLTQMSNFNNQNNNNNSNRNHKTNIIVERLQLSRIINVIDYQILKK